jgi:hypothetical protein
VSLTAARLLLVAPLAFAAARPSADSSGGSSPGYASTPAVALAVGAIGLSNGLLATRTMCLGPELVPDERLRGAAAGLLVLALYWGIGVGAGLGLLFGELVLFEPSR